MECVKDYKRLKIIATTLLNREGGVELCYVQFALFIVPTCLGNIYILPFAGFNLTHLGIFVLFEKNMVNCYVPLNRKCSRHFYFHMGVV